MEKKELSSSVMEPLVESETSTENHKRIGILGGTFNPPHLAHLIVAEQVYESLDLDAIHFMPTNEPGHAVGKETIPADYRVDMVDFAIEDNPNFWLNLTEVNRPGKTYTIDTMKELKEANPDTEYYFIIGGDMVADLSNWKDIDKLVKLVHFVGVNRPGYEVETDYPVVWVDTLEVDISSSLIRKRVKEGLSIKYLTTDAVIDYIQEKALYIEDDTTPNEI